MQLWASTGSGSHPGFNPHRLRRAGATRSRNVGKGPLGGFNPHRLRRAGATRKTPPPRKIPSLFQSSPAPKSRCNAELRQMGIITIVSILTGSEEPVQQIIRFVGTVHLVFQSSPAPKSRCNYGRGILLQEDICFNPHRLRRAGATARLGLTSPLSSQFQSSPAPKSRCNRKKCAIVEARWVSILTGSEEPVQRVTHKVSVECFRVSILTGSEEPVQPGRMGISTEPSTFQSSPAPKSRCNCARKADFDACLSTNLGSAKAVCTPATLGGFCSFRL